MPKATSEKLIKVIESTTVSFTPSTIFRQVYHMNNKKYILRLMRTSSLFYASLVNNHVNPIQIMLATQNFFFIGLNQLTIP